MILKYSFVANRFSQTEPASSTWGELCDYLLDDSQYATGKEGRAIVPAEMRAGPSQSEKTKGQMGRWRQSHLVESVQLLGLDFDKHVPDDWIERLRAWACGYDRVAWTTHSHMRPGKGNRARVLLPLSAPVSRSRYRDIVRHVMGELEAVGLVADRSCSDATRVFYLPRKTAEDAMATVRAWAWIGSGPFDVESVPVPEPAKPREVRAVVPVPTGGQNGIHIVDEFCKAVPLREVLESSGLYERSGDDRYLYHASETRSAGLRVSPCKHRPGCEVAWSEHDCPIGRITSRGVQRRQADAYDAMREIMCDGDPMAAADYARQMLGWPSRTEVAERREVWAMAAQHADELVEDMLAHVEGGQAEEHREDISTALGYAQEPPSESVYDLGGVEGRDAMRVSLAERLRGLSVSWGAVVELCRASSPYWQPGLTVGACVALGSVLAARRWRWGGLLSSTYVLSVADSGAGKGGPHGTIKRALGAWPEVLGPGTFSSSLAGWQLIAGAATQGHGILFAVDEYEAHLGRMLSPRASGHVQEWRSQLLELATIGEGVRRVSKSIASGGGQDIAHAPALTVHGTATPGALWAALGGASMSDGLIPRHLVAMGLAQLPERHRGRQTPPVWAERTARDAVEASRAAHGAWIVRQGDEGPLVYQGAEDVELEAGVQDALDDLAEEIDDYRRRHVEGGVPDAVAARTAEQAVRVALSLAALVEPSAPIAVITHEVWALARDIALLSAADLAVSYGEHAAASEYEAQRLRVLGALRHETPSAGDGWVPQSRLYKRARMSSRVLREVLSTLAEAGEVEMGEVKSKTRRGESRATALWRLKGG